MSDDLLAAAAAALEQAAIAIRAELDARCRLPAVAKKRWRVTARAPKGRDGKNCQLRFFPPPGEGRPGKEGKPFQQSAGTPDLEEAKRIAQAQERELNGECLPFAEIARRYLLFLCSDGGTRPGTVVTYRRGLDRVIRHLDSQVTKETVLGLQDAMRVEPPQLAPVTINAYLGTAARAWEWARDRGLVTASWPAPKSLTVQETKLRPCTHEETATFLNALLAYADGRHYPFFVLLADLGSRVTETCMLRERDIDRQKGTITLRVTKTESRTVFASPGALELLPEGDDPDAWVFERPRAGGPYNRFGVYSVWHKVTKKLGMHELPICPHSLRKSWITDSLMEGVPIAQSMRHTGHRSIRTHLAYQRNAPDRGMAEVAATVRSARPRLPHETPTGVWGGPGYSPLQPIHREEAHGVTNSGRSRTPRRQGITHHDLRLFTPPQEASLRKTLVRLVLRGGDESAAVVALARDEILQRFVVDLDQRSTN